MSVPAAYSRLIYRSCLTSASLRLNLHPDRWHVSCMPVRGRPASVRTKHDLASLRINQSRLASAIHDGCKFGEAYRYGEDPTETGMARLSLNDADKQIRDWFTATAEALGCQVSVDQMGNQFAIRPGKNTTAPPVMMGSHLDTQPTGGRYDGILGINAGLEALRVLHENEVETEGSVGVVNWTNEEGARFPMMAVSSGVWAEAVPLEKAWNLAEVGPGEDGSRKTMKQELERIGYLGSQRASYRDNPFAAHFELHIEQGPILENERRKIGVVNGVQAFRWFEITVKGRDTHAGTTPMDARMDSMLCAAKLIVQSNSIAKQHQGLATTGILNGVPGSVNTMAHTVTFTLDIRHNSDEKLAEMEAQCRANFKRIAEQESEKGCKLEWRELVDSPAVLFHPDCIAAVKASAEEVCQDFPNTSDDGKLWSMIFTPTREGISHNPREYCSPEDCATGAQVLLGAVLRFDKLRADRGDFR